jgi:hypothetical protein
VHALHLGPLGLKSVQHFGLLIGSELKMLGQFLGAFGRIGRAVAAHTVVLRRWGLLIVGLAILSRRERRGDRDEAGCHKNEQNLFKHRNLLFKTNLHRAIWLHL